MSAEKSHGAVKVKIESLPFYKSMKIVQERTRLDDEVLINSNAGFRANPSQCICGHEWSIFDIAIAAVQQRQHNWEFFIEELGPGFSGFFHRTTSFACDCGVTTENVGVLYKYRSTKSRGWNY